MSISMSNSVVDIAAPFGVTPNSGVATPSSVIPYIGTELWAIKAKNVTGNATAPTADSITINEPTTTLAGVHIAVTSGLLVRVSGVLTLTSGQVDISAQTNLSGVITSLTTSGAFSFTMTSAGAVGFKRSFDNGAVCSIADLTVYNVFE